MRYTHIIKHNKNTETPHRAVWIAVHAHKSKRSAGPDQYKLDFAWCCFGVHDVRNNTWRFQSVRLDNAHQFWRWLDQIVLPKTRTYILCQNSNLTLSMMDAFTIAFKHGWTLTRAIIECPPCIVLWRRDTSTIEWLDNANVWPQPSNGTSIGKNYEHSTTSIDDSNAPTLDEKTQHDVRTMRSLWIEWWDFLRQKNMAGFAPTIASQSMRIYRHKYMQHEILIDTNVDALKLARAAYVGARTECFYIGKMHGTFYLLDINSMYASVMRDMRVPTRLRGYTEHATTQDLAAWTQDAVVLCDVDVNLEIPLLPYRQSNSLLFPTGVFRCAIAGSEVSAALDAGCIRQVYRVAVYDWAPAFTHFVQSMWDLRRAHAENGELADADKYKTLLASFYGKWGQTGGVWEKTEDARDSSIKTWINVDYHTNEITEYRQFGGIVQVRSKEDESYESHPAIAACITANARTLLWSYMMTAGRDHVFYVDTDSLLVDQEGLHQLEPFIAPATLGGLRLEGLYHDIEIFAPKDYRFGSRTRHKGVRSNSVVVDTATFEQDQNSSLVGMMREGNLSTLTTMRIRRKMLRKYLKGVVLNDGKVIPYEIKNW